ncbi:hypothetical protein [Hydrogenophaga sp.]|uniref:hypothetical protein n=1 Tax=Hydrogenophaga sp. TaxID=1904254 RepID=UPI003F6D4BD3
MAQHPSSQSQPVVRYVPPGAAQPVSARITDFHRNLDGSESVTLRTLGGNQATHHLTLAELKNCRTDGG